MAEPPPATNDHPICPWCQYDLHGLPAEKNLVRCPECGNQSNLQLLRIDPEERRKKLWDIDKLIALCTAAFIMFIACASTIILSIAGIHVFQNEGELSPLYIVMLLMSIVWSGSFAVYRYRYKHVTGSPKALFKYHICNTLLVAGTFSTLAPFLLLGGKPVPARTSEIIMLSGLILLAAGLWTRRLARNTLKNIHAQLVMQLVNKKTD